MKASRKRTSAAKRWTPPSTSSTPELVTMRWVAPTPMMAAELRRRVEDAFHSAKIRSPLLPGWYVRTDVTLAGCTVFLSLTAEPEAEVPRA